MEYDKQAYREKKQAELSAIFATLNEATEEIAKESAKYRSYLEIQARMDRYSVSNAILFMKQKPDVTQLKSFDDWEALGVRVKQGEKSIAILKPYKYQKTDGRIGTGYHVKREFDISQTDVVPRRNRFLSGISERDLLKALINQPPVPIEVVEALETGKNAEYDHQNGILFIRRGLEPDTFFRDVSMELALAGFADVNADYTKEFYTEKAKAVSYMLCKKCEIDPCFKAEVPASFSSKEAKEVRSELSECREIFKGIEVRMRDAMEKQREAKKEQER